MTDPAGRPVPPPPPPAAGHGLHPLTLSRILGLTFGMLRFRWRTLFGAAVLPLLPAHALVAVVQVPYVQTMNQWLRDNQRLLSPAEITLPARFGETLLVLVGTGLLLALIGLVATAAVTGAAGDVYAGRNPTVTAALGQALRRLPSVIGAHLLFFLALLGIVMAGVALSTVFFLGGPGGGLMPFLGLIVVVGAVAAAVFVLVRWSLIMPALMVEHLGAMEALGRSWRLVAGSGWRVLGYLLLIGILVGVLGAVLVQIGYFVVAGSETTVDPGTILAQSLVAGFVTTLLTPIAPVAMLLLYFDIRWRQGEKPD
jgi:hypothetical protein